MSPKEYINKFSKFIGERLKGSPLLASVVMAHALYESADDDGYIGKSIHAASYNNDVRLRADRTWKGPKVQLPVRQLGDGSKRKRKVWFRVYCSSEESIADRIAMLTKKVSSWPKTFWYEDTLKVQAAMLQRSLSSADPRYGERIVYLVNKHKLYQLDTKWMTHKVIRIAVGLGLTQLLWYALQYWDAVVPWR